MKQIHILLSLAAMLFEAAAATCQTVATGEKPIYEKEFRSPMVLEVPFVLADPARWNGGTWSSRKGVRRPREVLLRERSSSSL